MAGVGAHSQLGNQAVITTTTARWPGPELITGDLKGRVAVVIKRTSRGLSRKGIPRQSARAGLLQNAHGWPPKGIRQGGGLFQQRLGVLVFGIQNAQRIGAQPRLGIGIESFRPLLEPSHQGSAVGLAILRRPRLFNSSCKPPTPRLANRSQARRSPQHHSGPAPHQATPPRPDGTAAADPPGVVSCETSARRTKASERPD